MKKLIVPLTLTLLCYTTFFFIIDLKPYLAGPVPSAAESGGAIPPNLWLSTGLSIFAMIFIVAALICQVWVGARFSLFLDERREKRKKHEKGI